MIRKILLSTVAIAAISGTAFAADLPSRRAPPVFVPPPIPIFSWTGFYIGGQAGYEFGSDRSTIVNRLGNGVRFNVGQTAAAIGGGHVGYNYELNGFGGGPFGGGLVIGVEGDIEGSTNTSSVSFGAFNENHRADLEGSARGRLGLAVDRALFYVTGGAAFGDFRDNYNNLNRLRRSVNIGNTRVGYTVGGGVEYAITPQWSLRGEYRYTDFGSYGTDVTNVFPNAVRRIIAFNRPIEEKVEFGFSYKFDSPVLAPVVARY